MSGHCPRLSPSCPLVRLTWGFVCPWGQLRDFFLDFPCPVFWSFCAHPEPPPSGTWSTHIENSTEGTSVSTLIVIGLVVAAYYTGRVHQFVRDARSVLGLDKNDKKY
jgi:hypothetical protein